MEIISSLTSESKHLDASSCCWVHLQSRSILTSHFLQAESQVKGQWDTFPQLSVMCLLEINQKHLLPEKQVGTLCPCGHDGLAVPLQGSSKVAQCEWSPCSELSWESLCQAWPPVPWPPARAELPDMWDCLEECIQFKLLTRKYTLAAFRVSSNSEFCLREEHSVLGTKGRADGGDGALLHPRKKGALLTHSK